MRPDGRPPTLDELSEICRKTIARGDFQHAALEDLDAWSRLIVREFLDSDDIGWSVAKLPVGYVVKIDDAFLKYLITLPLGAYANQDRDQFYWLIGDDPNDDAHGISPDDAMLYLLRRFVERRK